MFEKLFLYELHSPAMSLLCFNSAYMYIFSFLGSTSTDGDNLGDLPMKKKINCIMPHPLLIYSGLISKMPCFVVVNSDQHLDIDRMSMRRDKKNKMEREKESNFKLILVS